MSKEKFRISVDEDIVQQIDELKINLSARL